MKNTTFFKPLSFWQFMLAALVLSLIVTAALFRNAFISIEAFLISLAWAFAISVTQWIGPLTINFLLDKKLRWMEKPILRSVVELALIFLWSVSAYVLVQIIMYFIVHNLSPMQTIQAVRGSIVLVVMIALFIALLFTTIGFFISWRKSVLNEAELQTRMITYKYEALRAQLNPHFLFNSLNVLNGLVYSDPDKAVRFISQLSSLFHYVLDIRDKETVPLADEAKFLDAYAFLLKTRFENKINIETDLNEISRYHIVPMSLQLLVENAVKHNEISGSHPLQISVRGNENYIIVENIKRGKVTGEISYGTGLSNLSEQYKHITGMDIEIEERENIFSVRIPLIKEI